jgi:hypothetical protein
MSPATSSPSEVNRDEVAAEAYRLSLKRVGALDPIGDWFEAEALVAARMEERRKQHADAAQRVITPAPEDVAVPARTVSAAAKAAAQRAMAAKEASKAKATSAPAGRPNAAPSKKNNKR